MSTVRSYDVQSLGSHVVMTLRPELNDAQWSDIERIGSELLREVESRSSPACLLDLSPLSYMGSATVAMIVRIWKVVNARTGRFVVVCGDELVLKVLSLAGLDKVWTITETREDGLKQLGIKSGGGSHESGHSEVIILGVCGAAAAVIGLILAQVPTVAPSLSFGLLFGGSVIGFALGLFCVISTLRSQRLIGVGLILACVVCGVIGAIQRTGLANLVPAPTPEVVKPAPKEPVATKVPDATKDPDAIPNPKK